jgi:hypothetical protein
VRAYDGQDVQTLPIDLSVDESLDGVLGRRSPGEAAMYLAGGTPSILRNIVTNPLALSYPSSDATRCTVAPRDIFWMARMIWSCRRHRPKVSPVSSTRIRFNVRSPTPPHPQPGGRSQTTVGAYQYRRGDPSPKR